MSAEQELERLLDRCERIYGDVALEEVKAWKAAHPGRPAIGHLPVYVPREVIHAAGALPVALQGGGDQVDIVRGDACFQSYICHLPRSTVELGLQGELDLLEGLVFPSTCDVIRNLSGIWQLLFQGKYVRYLDLPQALNDTGGLFYLEDLEGLMNDVAARANQKPDKAAVAASIRLYNRNRRALQLLYELRAEAPQLVAADEAFLVARAGGQMEVSAHSDLVETFVSLARKRNRRKEDRIRVVAIGAFCEQPPLGLLRTLERSGCYVVDDDLNLGARWIQGDVEPGDFPLKALSKAYLVQSTWASVRFEDEQFRGDQLVARVKALRADGVIFAAPSFCDPALLDQPPLQKALTDANLPFISFKYAENTGQFQGFREQAGTFSDSLKLWGTT
ncbi:MAG: benzoyl-CoA reductase subunit C [Myxococcales bacterium]|nr:benzoyl-CoA reductase subunit C [Myxococcales bacterium]